MFDTWIQRDFTKSWRFYFSAWEENNCRVPAGFFAMDWHPRDLILGWDEPYTGHFHTPVHSFRGLPYLAKQLPGVSLSCCDFMEQDTVMIDVISWQAADWMESPHGLWSFSYWPHLGKSPNTLYLVFLTAWLDQQVYIQPNEGRGKLHNETRDSSFKNQGRFLANNVASKAMRSYRALKRTYLEPPRSIKQSKLIWHQVLELQMRLILKKTVSAMSTVLFVKHVEVSGVFFGRFHRCIF